MAWTRSSAAAWMLLALLPLTLTLPTSKPPKQESCKHLHELNSLVKRLGTSVKDCPSNCSSSSSSSSSSSTEITCKCYNISKSTEAFSFPEYFIKGLQGLQGLQGQRAPVVSTTSLLLRKMEAMLECKGKMNFTLLSINFESLVSLSSFHVKLQETMEQLNTLAQL